MRKNLSVGTYTYLWVAINLCGNEFTQCKRPHQTAYIKNLTVAVLDFKQVFWTPKIWLPRVKPLEGAFKKASWNLARCNSWELSWNVHCMKITIESIECSKMIRASGFAAEIHLVPQHHPPRLLPGRPLEHEILAKRILDAKAYRVVPQSVDSGSCIQGIHLPKVFETSITSSINVYQIIPWDQKMTKM